MEHFLIVPEAVYILLLICSWISALFSGIAFVYGIQLKKAPRTVVIWGGVFAFCLLLVFLLMNGMITAVD